MAYQSDGSLTTDKRTVDDTTTWDSQADWEAYQSATGVEIVNGAVELAQSPDSGISRFNFEQDYVDVWDGNDGTPSGDVSFVGDAQQGQYAVDMATGGSVSFGTNGMPTGDSPLSVLMWVKTNESDVVYAYGAPNQDQAVGINSGGGVFYWGGPGTAGGSFGDGAWHQAGLRYQSGDLDLILDGSPVDALSPTLDLSSNNHRIGENINEMGEVAATVDNLQIFDKYISDQEAQNHYDTGSILG